ENFAVTQLQGHLASIHNDAQNGWIQVNMLGNCGLTGNGWIGLWDPSLSQVIPTCGATCDDHRPWTWTDGTPFDYTHWNNGEPNNGRGAIPPGQEHYVEIRGTGWNDIALAGTPPNGSYGIIRAGPSLFPDMNCDGVVDCNDIPQFVLAAIDQAGY